MVPALSEHCDIDDDACLARGIGREYGPALCLAHIAGDHDGWYVRRVEGCCDILGMRDGGTESDGLAVPGFFLPVLDHGIGHRDGVHYPGHFIHVEIIAAAPDIAQFILHTDINDEGSRCHEMAGGDQFTEPDLIRHIGEYLPQPDLVATIGRGGHAIDAAIGVLFPRAVNDAPIALRDGVMGFINHQQVKPWHGVQVHGARQRGHHGKGDLARPGFLAGIDNRGGHAWIHAAKLRVVL